MDRHTPMNQATAYTLSHSADTDKRPKFFMIFNFNPPKMEDRLELEQKKSSSSLVDDI
jgi:hypothetical protein